MGSKRNFPLGIVLSTVTDAPISEFSEIGSLAEAAGLSSVYVNEGRGDAIACAQSIAAATSTIHVGTNIANIYFRHPFLAAQSARTVGELSKGRFILGLGMSHRALLATLGIDMGNAREHLAEYVEIVVKALRGEGGAGFLRPPAAAYPVPVLVAGNTLESARVAGQYGDGLMPFLSPVSYLPGLVEAAKSAAQEAQRDPDRCTCVISIPTFISDNNDDARSAARYNLAFFAQLPNYRRQWRRAGYRAACDQLKEIWTSGGNRREAAAAVPDELVEDVCVFGDRAQCEQQLAAFHKAGADEPVIAVSPVNEDRLTATRRAIQVFTTS